MATPHLYSCLENPMDRGAQLGTVHGVAESDTMGYTQHNPHLCLTEFYFLVKKRGPKEIQVELFSVLISVLTLCPNKYI